jgi:hypothetical protein
LSESLKRAVVTQGERQAGTELTFSSDAATDDTSLSAPLAALSVSYQFFEKTPLLFRVWGGAMSARVKHELSGTFRGDVPYVDDPDMTFALEQPVSVREPTVNVWVPVFGPEVRFGYRVSPRFAVDLGVAGLMFLGPSKLRTGGNVGTTSRRPTSLKPEEDGAVQPGVMRFDEEESVSTFFALVPTLGARVDF